MDDHIPFGSTSPQHFTLSETELFSIKFTGYNDVLLIYTV